MYTHKCTDTCTHTREGALRESGWGRAVGRGAVAFWMPAYPEVGVPEGGGPSVHTLTPPVIAGRLLPASSLPRWLRRKAGVERKREGRWE